MNTQLAKWCLSGLCVFIFYPAFSQIQSCPANVNFSFGTLTNWNAYTGDNTAGNGPSAIKTIYDSTVAAPTGTIGAVTIPEYLLTVPGIRVETVPSTDVYGGFPTIPVINGYHYDYSILLGSTTINVNINPYTGLQGGGYVRGISYNINVPPGPVTTPYTMTYAYAMVLENGNHNSDQQPMFSATLTTADSVITCASPSYDLPTLNNASSNGNDATLDTAAALRNGFTNSSKPSPNVLSGYSGHLFDVWTKGWTEVTFDLSPYRGQQVTLTFEADNCVPGGHFAYAYVALRNTCAGLQISGDSSVCSYNNFTYSVPSLTNATYQWDIPSSWTIVSGDTTNIIHVTAGNKNGTITVEEQNSCADLKGSFPVTTTPPSVGGTVSANAEVCTGNNSSNLLLSGNVGNVLEWISSTDSTNWNNIAETNTSYTAQNLTHTTEYAAVVQTGPACAADTSTLVTVTVDRKSVGGEISPDSITICLGQNISNVLSLSGDTGNILDWQYSPDNIHWANITPADTDSFYTVGAIAGNIRYRTIVQSGVCPKDTSSIADAQFYNSPFPKVIIDPADTAICYGQSVPLNAAILIGTNYTWSYTDSLMNEGNGIVTTTPYIIDATAIPLATSNYILGVQNAGCPYTLKDTFHVAVIPVFTVNVGNDTTIVVNQPLQLNAASTDIIPDNYTWSPGFYLDNSMIKNPVAVFNTGVDSFSYVVKATDSVGCYATDTINVKIYNLNANLYVPTAFTPNGDGLNDIFKPILLGMKSLTLFSIYNRWGQLLFSTTQAGNGWDGTYEGNPQETGNYVWIANGIDYHGNNIQQRGNVVLLR
jgi:gliding motility-associated-like protein